MTAPEIPGRLPLSMQDIDITRCVLCGAITPGSWTGSRNTQRHAVDHLLDRHRDVLASGRCPRPPFRDCAIQDPFWFDEHAPQEAQ